MAVPEAALMVQLLVEEPPMVEWGPAAVAAEVTKRVELDFKTLLRVRMAVVRGAFVVRWQPITLLLSAVVEVGVAVEIIQPQVTAEVAELVVVSLKFMPLEISMWHRREKSMQMAESVAAAVLVLPQAVAAVEVAAPL